MKCSKNKKSSADQSLGVKMIVFAWVLCLALASGIFNKHLNWKENPNTHLNYKKLNEGGKEEVILRQNTNGHYVAKALINQKLVTVILDTGATTVAIPEHIALDLKLKKGKKRFASTANGHAIGYMSKLDSIQLGGIVLHNIPGIILPNYDNDRILLGMSFLKNLKFKQENNTLILQSP